MNWATCCIYNIFSSKDNQVICNTAWREYLTQAFKLVSGCTQWLQQQRSEVTQLDANEAGI